MRSVDSNILLYAYDKLCAEHESAFAFVQQQAPSTEFAICELVLIELYNLIRNPAVVRNPLSSKEAVEVCQTYRHNRNWLVIDYPGNLMSAVWKIAGGTNAARRSIYDARLALTLRRHGVTEFATRNTKHFQSFGFKRVWDPLK